MRELKFRAWDQIDKIMVLNGASFSSMDFIYPIGFQVKDHHEIIIMQYIVTEDNNDIYEKDVIEEWKHGRLIRTFVAEDIRTFIREYDQSEHNSIWKVIGNVYENPEFLKREV